MELINMKHYPISLTEIKERVAKKNGRNSRKNARLTEYLMIDNIGYPNVKEQINEFGEKIVRVDGEIPVELPIKNGQRVY